jgi:F-type H+-transporting ATPase subunit b
MSLNPLEQIDLATMAAVAVIFLATSLILRKMFFLPLIGVMEKRARKLEHARAIYDNAEALIERARNEAARMAAETSEAADRMAKEAQDELTRTRDASIAEANAKAQTILARGRNEVAQVREAEQAKLREQLLVCSRQTLAKMIGDVNEDSLRFIVSRVLTAREAAE